VIDIFGVRIGAGSEQQVDDLAGPREVQRRLPIASALVHARRILAKDYGEEVLPVQLRRGARVRLSARREQAVGNCAFRGVQRMEATSPPAAPAVRIGAELEQRIHHVHVSVTRNRHEGRRVETKQWIVDGCPRFRTLSQHASQCRRVAVIYGAPELVNRGGRHRIHRFASPRHTAEVALG
jgi:hypothetical protein